MLINLDNINMKSLNDFTNLYPVSKTLRFKLIPVGKTLENFKASGILEEDTRRAENYLKVKSIIDDYHKAYIDLMLSDFHFIYNSSGRNNSLEEYYTLYSIRKKNDKELELFKKTQTSLRKQIADRLTGDERYKRIFKKELIQQDLIEYIKNYPDSSDKEKIISEFRNFTVYFTGFHENRKNMYSEEEKSTAIAYRIVHENLPRFIDNMNVFSVISDSPVSESFEGLYKEYEEYLQVISLGEIFMLDSFDIVLTQKHLDVYNAIVGQINQLVNLYNQQNKDNRLPKLKVLFKQILSDREHLSWLPEELKSDDEVVSSVNEFYKIISSGILDEGALRLLLETLREYDTDGIFIRNDLQLSEISQRFTGSWDTIPVAIKRKLENDIPRKKKESEEEYQNRVNKYFKSCSSFSISFIDKCLSDFGVADNKIEDYFGSLGAVNTDTVQKENHFARIRNAYISAKDVLDLDRFSNERGLSLRNDSSAIQKIKELLDAVRDLLLFVKPLLGNGDEPRKDERFYGDFLRFWQELNGITPLYNKVRNYVTKKPYSQEKIKLNFQNPTFLDGWDLNKETDYTSVILRRNGLYYLAVMRKNSKKVFESYPEGDKKSCYEKMEYKTFKDVTTMVPKCSTQLKNVVEHFKSSNENIVIADKFVSPLIISREIFDLNNITYDGKKKFQKDYLKNTQDVKGYKEAVNVWIKFCVDFIKSYKSTSIYDLSSLGDIANYTEVDKFYADINKCVYKLSFRNISSDYIDKLVEDGRIFLFQIYNKDFSPSSKGTPNMHTLYWKMIFDERNLADVVYKLNGQAEVFFRKASIKADKPTHPADVPIKNKSKDTERVLHYDLIKDKRYTVDQFQLHVPITLNFKAEGVKNINDKVLEYIRSVDDMHVIGIDRGERHLLYLVVSDLKGNICEQFSLNEIVSTYISPDKSENRYNTNYHDLLERKEEARMKASQSWQSIESIKELKEGYLSQVIHKISELMVKYNAIVVLEDLNIGFMRGRQKVEKSVYQKFEKMLIDKLNCLVLKQINPEQTGGVLHPYQFTNKFESFGRMGKQNGFLFYIPAWNTSKIDPATGFVNLFNAKYESIEKTKVFFSKFDIIRYNKEKDRFDFSFDYNSFDRKAESTRTQWTVSTYGTRIMTFRNKEKNSQWDNVEIDLTERYKDFFNRYGIDINGNIKDAINNFPEVKKDFFEELMGLFRLTLQMRNSVTGTDIDYLLSPVANEKGIFYDSRSADKSMPENADANGAYNIARKGIMLIDRIKKTDNIKNINFAISNKEWLEFAQSNTVKV